jgi:MarR family transcriptional repressor of emrRAB
MQINSSAQFELVEAHLKQLGERIPELPVPGILMCRMILTLGREMAAGFEQKIRPFGLNEPEFRVLSTLFSQASGVAHPGDLCAAAAQSPANMSRIADALVSRHLITRVLSVQDRRRMELRITEKGEQLVRTLLPKMIEPLNDMLRDFPESDQLQVIALLKRLATVLDQSVARETLEQMA